MCGINVCPIHTRTNVMDQVQPNAPIRAVTYEGDYAISTLDNPDFTGTAALLGFLQGEPMPPMLLTLVVKVGPDKTLGDILEADQLDDLTVFRQAFLEATDGRLQGAVVMSEDKFNDTLTEIVHEAHILTVESVKSGIVS